VRLLTEAYNHEVLAKLSSKPAPADEANLPALEKSRDALKAKITKGNERYLSTPEDLMPGIGESLRRWQQELKDLEDKIRSVQLKSGDEQAAFEKWVDQIGKNLKVLVDASQPSTTAVKRVKIPKAVIAAVRKRYGKQRVIHARLTWDASDQVEFDKGPMYEINAKDAAWLIEQTGSFKGPVVVEDAVLRQFLHYSGAKVTLYWKPRGKRFFELDKARLEAEFGNHFLASDTK
jgi:hypothetical protein